MGGPVGRTHLPVDKRNSDFLIEVGKGNIPGHSYRHKFGHGTVGQTIAPLCVSGVYQTPLAPVSLEFISDDPADTALGLGAREIEFTGINGNYNETTFTIDTNGTTAVPLPTDLLRLFSWGVLGSGTYATAIAGSHAGGLTVRVAGAGATWSQIETSPFPAGRSEIGAYTVPLGFTGYIIQQELHVDSAKSVDVVIFKRPGINIVTAPFTAMTTMSHYVGVTGINSTDYKVPLDSIPAMTDIGYMGIVTAQTADISVHFTIMLVADGY